MFMGACLLSLTAGNRSGVEPLRALGRTEFGEGLGRQEQFHGQLGPADRELESNQAVGTLFEHPHIPACGVARRQLERRRVGWNGKVGLHAASNAWRVPAGADVSEN